MFVKTLPVSSVRLCLMLCLEYNCLEILSHPYRFIRNVEYIKIYKPRLLMKLRNELQAINLYILSELGTLF